LPARAFSFGSAARSAAMGQFFSKNVRAELYNSTNMIEVEKNFVADEEATARVTEGATFLGERILSDVYFDTVDYRLSRKDWWLRARNGKMELKVPINDDRSGWADRYEELEDEWEIRNRLGFSDGKTLDDQLKKNGFEILYDFITTRNTWKKGVFTIDADSVIFPSFTYQTVEIEVLVDDVPEIKIAEEQIKAFAAELGLLVATDGGKMVVYLKREKPDHYQILVKNDVIRATDG